MAKILLNGLGRIGKAILRSFLERGDHSICFINEKISNIKNIAYSLNYDSTYGRLYDLFEVQDSKLKNSVCSIEVLNFINLGDIDLQGLDVDIIIDASGTSVDINKYKSLSVKKVFLTHPNKDADLNMILGVNETLYSKSHTIISTSSCNATCLMPIIKLIDDNYTIINGDITTIHPFLSHQKVLDNGCVSSSDRNVECNFEFGRSSVQNIIPSKTTTVQACSYVDSSINEDMLSSNSLRVPTQTVGAINVVVFVEKKIEQKSFLQLCKKVQDTQNYKICYNNYDPLVSSDFQKCEYTSIIDHRFTQIKGGNMLKLTLWYDNEWGYATKVVDIIDYIREKEKNENHSK